MTWYALPAAVALLIKLYLIVAKIDLAKHNSAWYYFVIIFAINNFAELLVLSSSNIIESNFLARAYHPTAIAVLVYCLIYSIGSNSKFIDRILIKASSALGVALSLFILFSDYIVTGATQESYFVTSVKGGYYYFFQAYVLSMCLVIGYILVRNFRYSDDKDKRNESLWVMLALMPSVLITFTSVALMVMQFKFNALILTPVGSTIFLLVTLLSYSKGVNREKIDGVHRKNPRKYIPFTIENKTCQFISEAEDSFLAGDLTLPEFMAKVEHAALSYASKKQNGNATQIAEMMGIGRSTLYQKGVRLGVEWKEDRS